MNEERAKEILTSRVRSGHCLEVIARGDFRVIKRLLVRVLDADIPCILGPCTVGA